jgi:hypothetical protein
MRHDGKSRSIAAMGGEITDETAATNETERTTKRSNEQATGF